MKRQIEYLNARGLSVYALEVSYFADDADALFVPRIVARPTVASRVAGRDSRPAGAAVEQEGYFVALADDRARDAVRQLIDDAPDLGGEVYWGSGGYPRVRLLGDKGPRVILSLPTERPLVQ